MTEFNCLDNCPNLGACCRDFFIVTNHDKIIGQGKPHLGKQGANRLLKGRDMPFEATRYDWVTEAWLFSCANLTAAGLCGCYEERPEICRHFRAGSNKKLCYPPKTFRETIVDLLECFGKLFAFGR